MNEHGEQERTPAFHTWLCGAFRVERRIEAAYEVVRTAEWGGSSYPRLLLKALLCGPGRQARREALIEQLWPEQETLSASRSGAFSPAPPFDSQEVMIVDSSQPFILNEVTTETLAHFSELLAVRRHLSEGNELQVAERTLWAYLPRIENIAKRSLDDQQDLAAALVSQGYLLAASLAGHRNDLQARYRYSEQALLYGKLAGDRNLQIAALRQLSITFDYLERPENVLHIYQQVFPYLGDVSPLLRACVYAGVSGAYAQLHQQAEAFDFMNRAYDHFPSHPEREPDYLHTICCSSTLVFFDGLNYLDLGQPHEAEKVLARVDGLHPTVALPERVRIEALNYQIEVFLTLHAMDQACVYLEAAVQAALIPLKREKVFRQKLQLFWGEFLILERG